jgi:hypothetical protein
MEGKIFSVHPPPLAFRNTFDLRAAVRTRHACRRTAFRLSKRFFGNAVLSNIQNTFPIFFPLSPGFDEPSAGLQGVLDRAARRSVS